MDRIILLFDAHKLDISDEFSEVIKALKNHEDKIRYRKLNMPKSVLVQTNLTLNNYCDCQTDLFMI